MTNKSYQFWKYGLMDQYFTMPAELLVIRFGQWLDNLSGPEKNAIHYYANRIIIRMFLCDHREPGLSADYAASDFPEIAKPLIPIIHSWKEINKI